jgi:hypothetical protein
MNGNVMNMLVRTLLAVVVLGGMAVVARSENIDLSTVPRRDTVQLTIYNSEDLTLVRETRVVTFKKGVNPLQFSWANTLIDPSSVELRFLTSADQLEVLDTTFPHDKPQMLYWNVQSDMDGEATIQITYFTSGITWSADYLGIAAADEATMGIEGFVRVTNHSGEEYEDAQIRLVVGTINLVEKIAQLAQIPMDEVASLEQDKLRDFRREAAAKSMNRPSHGAMGGEIAAGAPEEKEIIKEGLSEYFIYTVEGTETIPDGWSKRMRSFEAKDVPLKIQYRYRPQEYGDQLVRMYLMTNDEKSKLGTTPLPDGVVRVFRDNGRDGLSYLTQQTIKYIPIGDKIELNLGPDPEVIFELVKLRTFRDHLWMQIHGTNTFKQVGDETTAVEVNSSVVGWDDHSIYSQRIRNYTAKPIDVEIRRTYAGHIVFRSQLEPKRHDFQTVEFGTQVANGARKDLLFEVLQHQGRNAKQNNVTLEEADVKP